MRFCMYRLWTKKKKITLSQTSLPPARKGKSLKDRELLLDGGDDESNLFAPVPVSFYR